MAKDLSTHQFDLNRAYQGLEMSHCHLPEWLLYYWGLHGLLLRVRLNPCHWLQSLLAFSPEWLLYYWGLNGLLRPFSYERSGVQNTPLLSSHEVQD